MRKYGFNTIKLLGLSTLFIQCASEEKPNIILVMADDQGWGDTGYNGHPVLKTPNLDDMAVSGLRFDHFYAAAPVSSPTRGSVMTGRHPNRFGCFSWGYTLRPQEITIAEALKTAGYATGHFGKWHLGSVRKDSPVNPGNSGFDEWFSSPNFFDNDPVMSREGIAVRTIGESSVVTVDAALEFIKDKSEKKKPFLAVIWFGSPHNPYIAEDQDLQLYAGEEEKMQNYYGEITGMDRAIGKLRNELKSLGISENTLVWYCSDNGGLAGFGSTGGRGAKSQIYEGGLRVPAIIEWPARIKKSRITDSPSNTSDIYPTLLELTGVTIDEQLPLDGVSLVPLIDDKTRSITRPMGFWQYPIQGRIVPSAKLMEELLGEQENGFSLEDSTKIDIHAGEIQTRYEESLFPGHSAWLNWPWKLHRIDSGNGEPVLELYNLEQDPGELNDLSVNEPETVNALKSEIESWLKSVIFSLNGGDYN
ncbi:MAG TPA: sulfatase-like hydrolase/transferase [Bacteroidales bacterium]|nr:sulfatase-like hydrolase/transferase [Bacteroidales bacterium]